MSSGAPPSVRLGALASSLKGRGKVPGGLAQRKLWTRTSLYVHHCARICVCVFGVHASQCSQLRCKPSRSGNFLSISHDLQTTPPIFTPMLRLSLTVIWFSRSLGKGRMLGKGVGGQALPQGVPLSSPPVSSTGLPPRAARPSASAPPQPWWWMWPTALQPRRVPQVFPSGPWTQGWR